MKYLLLIALLLPANLFAQEYRTYAEAHAAAVAQDKPMFVMFTASWCAPCQKNKLIFHEGNIWEGLNRQFIVHYVDVDKELDTVKLFKAAGVFEGTLPTTYFLNEQGKAFTGRHVGQFESATSFISWYSFVHKDRLKKPFIPVPPAPKIDGWNGGG